MVGILFGVLAMPAIFAVGVAVDYGRLVMTKSELQAGVDAAAVAGASFNPKNDPAYGTQNPDAEFDKRKALAQANINENLKSLNFGHTPVTEIQQDGDDGIYVSAESVVNMTFASLFASDHTIKTEARAKFIGVQAPMCMLTLNDSDPETFSLSGNATLKAPDCAVYSNSSSSTGMSVTSSATASARGFCTAGGYEGSGYTPEPLTGCKAIDDPYSSQYSKQALLASGVLESSYSEYKYAGRSNNIVSGNCFPELTATNGTDLYFSAGGPTSKLCFDGMKINGGGKITLGPGIYIVTDELKVNGGGTLVTNEATIILAENGQSGNKADRGELSINGGANLDLNAPTSGDMHGMAIIDTSTSDDDDEHKLNGGGSVEITGIIYFPETTLNIGGNGSISGSSDFFVMVANKLDIKGNGDLVINAAGESVSATMPPLMVVTVSGGASITQ